MRFTNDARTYDLQIDGATDAFRIYDATASTERLRIDSSGNVGIGVSSPVRSLQIGDNTDDHEIISLQTSTTGKGSIYFGDNTATAAEYAGMIRYDHSDNAMTFRTQSQERMRLTSAGYLCVNRTDHAHGGQLSLDYTNGVTAGLAIKDKQTTGTGVPMQIVNGAGSVVGSITQNQSSTSFNTSSDYRLKENVVDIADGITRVKQLSPSASTLSPMPIQQSMASLLTKHKPLYQKLSLERITKLMMTVML